MDNYIGQKQRITPGDDRRNIKSRKFIPAKITSLKVNKIQNKALKIIHFKNIRDQSNPLYNQSKILKLRDHVAIENCLFVHKQQKGLPIIFNDHFTFINSQHNYNTRIARTNLNLPVVNTTTYGTLSITFRSILVWNKLHEKLKTNLLNYNLNSTKKLLHGCWFLF